jgi:hypothetical protein
LAVAVTLAVSVKSVVRVVVATPVLVPVAAPQVRATTVRLAVLLAAVAVVTAKRAVPTVLDRVAMVPSIGGSRRPLLAMRAAVDVATTTPESRRSAVTMVVEMVATMPMMPRTVFRTRVVEQEAVTSPVPRFPVVPVALVSFWSVTR